MKPLPYSTRPVRRSALALALGVAVLGLVAGTPVAGAAGTVGFGRASVELDDDTEVRRLPFPPLVFANPDPSVAAQLRVHGLLDEVSRLLSQDLPRRKGKLEVEVHCLDADGGKRLERRRLRLDANGNASHAATIPAGECELVEVVLEGSRGRQVVDAGSELTVSASLQATPEGTPNACLEDTVLCLKDGRFQIELDWRDFEERRGNGIALPASDSSGFFYFLDPEHLKLLISVLDGCSINGHYWLYGAATTNIEYTLTVTDTDSGSQQTFSNPLRTAAPAIVDLQAFATCP